MTKVRGLGWLAAVLLTALPMYAHEVEISGEVGATLHIEPNDRAKAGEPTQVWFALTAKGGRVIPLSECNCKLEVRNEPHKEGSPPLLEPALKSIVAEQYQGIPSAEVTFPKTGEYELELSGSPKPGAKFSPFSLSYKVVVAGKSEASKEPEKGTESTPTQPDKQAEIDKKTEIKGESKISSAETAKAETEAQSSPWWVVPSGIVLVGGVIGAAIWLIRSNGD